MRKADGHRTKSEGLWVTVRRAVIPVARLLARTRWRALAPAGLVALLIAFGLDQSSPVLGGTSPAAAMVGAAGEAASGSSSLLPTVPEREFVVAPEDPSKGGRYGTSIALSGDGDTALIGAPYEDGDPGQTEGPGAAWVFERSNGQWEQAGQELTMPAADSARGECGRETAEEATEEEGDEEVAHVCRFGISVALSGDGEEAVIGAPHAHNNNGAVFIFTRSGSTWTLAEELRNPREEVENQFGRSVAVSADGATVLVGAPMFEGQAWVFTRSEPTWTETAQLANPARGERGNGGQGRFGPGREGDDEGKGMFGQSVSLSADGQTALIGAPGYPGQKGAAWVFRDSGSGWSAVGGRLEVAGGSERAGETAEEKEARENQEGEAERAARFGTSVALAGDGETALVGARKYEGGRGAAWVFTGAGAGTGAWSEQAMLPGTHEPDEQFGTGVALSYNGDTALVGAPRNASYHGVALLFERSSSLVWTEQEQLLSSTAKHPQVRFGSSVALSGSAETRLVGGDTDEHRGAAWAFGPYPSVATVRPDEGSSEGGTTVTIEGEHLTEATAVRFGGAQATEVNVAPDGKSLTAVSPPGTGTVEVKVETPIGESAPDAPHNLFTYVSTSDGGGGGNIGGEDNNSNNSQITSQNEPAGASAQAGVLPFGPASGGACRASLLNKRISVLSRGRAVIELRGAGAGACAGKLALKVRIKLATSHGHSHRPKTKMIVIGTATFSISARQTRAVSVRLNSAGRRLLKAGHGRLNASLSIVKSTPAPSQASTASVRLTQRSTRPSAHRT